MYKNYEKRVKNFIIEMNDPETKIEIKDYEERINNPKTDLQKEKEIQKPFIFKGYTTEEDRIKDAIKRNRFLFNLPDYDDETNKNEKKEEEKPKINYFHQKVNDNYKKLDKKPTITRKVLISKAEENKYKYILKNDLIIQPEMRFKPRTDLERVYDMVNGYKYGSARRDVLDKQLKNMGLYHYKNSNELKKRIKSELKINTGNDTSESESENDNIHANSEIELINENKHSKLYYNPTNVDYKSKPWMKRTDLNTEAYKLLNIFPLKTHFKAAKEVAENNIKIKNKNKKNNYCLLLPNLFPNKTRNNSQILNFSYNKNNDIFMKLNDEIENINKIKYDKNKNPFKKNQKFEEKKIKLIEDIAFNKNKQGNNSSENYYDENKLFEKNVDEDNIMIDNEIFDKKNQFELITNKILHKCNIFNNKSKFNNTILKKRNGKLMFTRGLSINQFEQKYGFK